MDSVSPSRACVCTQVIVLWEESETPPPKKKENANTTKATPRMLPFQGEGPQPLRVLWGFSLSPPRLTASLSGEPFFPACHNHFLKLLGLAQEKITERKKSD